MSEITIYTTPTELCKRITRLFDSRGLPYRIVSLDTEAAVSELTERTGRRSCPLVFVEDQLIGGQQEAIEAVQSGRLQSLLQGSEQ